LKIETSTIEYYFYFHFRLNSSFSNDQKCFQPLTELKNLVLVSEKVPSESSKLSESVLRDGGACLAITEHVQAHIQCHTQAIEWIGTLSKDVFN
jgi:hypothetical protein